MFTSSFLLMSVRRKNVTVAVSRFIGYTALGGVVTSALQQQQQHHRTTTWCESSNDKNNFLDTLLPKDKDGKICWDKAPQQMTESIFWDKIAKAAGEKVCVSR
jgi:hypothetical protein